MIHVIRVTCTDRGRHSTETLRPLQVDTDTGIVIYAGRGAIPMQAAVVWEWRCPRCHRNPQISEKNHPGAWLRLAEAGVSEIDISRLSF